MKVMKKLAKVKFKLRWKDDLFLSHPGKIHVPKVCYNRQASKREWRRELNIAA